MDFLQDNLTRASIALQPYRNLVGSSATIFSVLQLLAPLFIFNNMRKAKSTLGIPFLPFLFGSILTGLNIRFSQLLNDEPTFQANLIGFSILVIYVTIFFYYVSPKDKFSHLMQMLGALTFIGLMIAYSKVEDPVKVESRFGFILTLVLYCLFAMPVLGIAKAMKEKCTRHIPYPMVIAGTLVGFSWMLHGIIINSGFIMLQNLVITMINVAQLALFLIYPSQPEKSTNKKMSKSKKGKKD